MMACSLWSLKEITEDEGAPSAVLEGSHIKQLNLLTPYTHNKRKYMYQIINAKLVITTDCVQ